MSKKAQMEMSPIALLLGLVGAVIAWVMAGRMGAGIFLKLISTVLTGVVCFFIGNVQANR